MLNFYIIKSFAKSNIVHVYHNVKVSVQGVVAFGGQFATLCQELDFYDAFFFSLLIFKKKREIL